MSSRTIYYGPLWTQEDGEEVETAEDRAFLDNDNHSQGDELLNSDHYVQGKCTMVIGYEPETDEEIVCGDACNPAEQICHFCRTMGLAAFD